jgi:CubicO group peptidase (beta-lactamase class C family)
MVSTSGDLVIWARALLGGEAVITQASLEAMLTPTDLPDGSTVGYGLGMGVGTSPFGPVAGHSGGIHGFRSDLLYFSDRDAAFTVLVNDGLADPQDIEIPIVEAVLASP